MWNWEEKWWEMGRGRVGEEGKRGCRLDQNMLYAYMHAKNPQKRLKAKNNIHIHLIWLKTCVHVWCMRYSVPVHMVVCTSAYESMHTGVLAHVGARGQYQVSSSITFCIGLGDRVFHRTWSSPVVWAQWQMSSRDLFFWHSPSTGLTNSCCHSQLLSTGDLNFGPHICMRSTLSTETRFLHRNLKTIFWVGFLRGIAVQWWLVFHQQRLVCVLSHLISPMCTKSPTRSTNNTNSKLRMGDGCLQNNFLCSRT